ncbi:MAG: carbohydrate ABC transporter permease [Provencibacterium sp.]|jgi:putative aldouronate transport system permease protein|nr:carbohydrate ABC transporter permease [Provencibacterium sp.]
MLKRTKGEAVFNVFNIILLSLVIVVTLYPLYYTFIASISEGSQVIRGNVVLWPVDMNLKAYAKIQTIDHFWHSYGNTLFYTFFGTLASLSIMSMGAYAISRKRLKGRRLVGMIVSFTMWFQAGMIPFYLNMDSLGLMNSRVGIIFGFACSAFYIIIMRTYFEGLPVELEESAKLDGLSNFRIFLQIMLPLAKPMLATITLYCAIDRWNGYFWAMILLKDINKIPLQVLLKKLIVENKMLASIDMGGAFDFTRETLVYAIVVIAILPMIAVYPFVQRFFVKGMTVGAVKG